MAPVLISIYGIYGAYDIQVTSMTALKFAELTVKAGFPPGVVNIIPGSGMVFHVNVTFVE